MATKKTKLLHLVGVKVRGKNVYLEEAEGNVRVTPAGRSQSPAELAESMPKGLRRKFRKALAANGHTDIVMATLAGAV
jgi:hypothetical protein